MAEFRRKFYDRLVQWKTTKHQECLLVKGARQIGKTFIIDQFGRNEYSSYLYLNFLLNPEHAEIFRVMADMNRQQTAIDLVTVQAELANRGSLDGVGGVRYLMKINADVPTAANVQAYIDIVREKKGGVKA